jgi:hypothetical protein
MSTQALVFDVETVADLDDSNRDSVAALAAGREMRAEEYAAFCPPLARVVCIAWYDLAAGVMGAVHDATFPGGGLSVEMSIADGEGPLLVISYTGCNGERELLRTFGEVVSRHYQKSNATLVTYSGRGFDLPVLIHRSVKHGVAEGRAQLIKAVRENRYNQRLHVDLLDTVTFFGAGSRWPLAAYAIGYGHRSPKGEMDGSQVGAAVADGRILDVVRYCAGDVIATTQIYRRVLAAGLLPA